jgi:uncharacterized protein YndB with AHSA1/START domain
MATQPQCVITRPSLARLSIQANDDPWEIAIHAMLNAEALRVFHALTMAEYREAWMRCPEGDETWNAVAYKIKPGYRIDFCRNGLTRISVTGSYHLYFTDEIVFSWCKRVGLEISRTIVHIRLKKNAGRTGLYSRHCGFASEAQRTWHQNFWTLSLEKLAWLLEGHAREASAK